MSRLIDRNGPREDSWVRIDDVVEAPLAAQLAERAGASLLLTLPQWQQYRDLWLAHDGPLGMLLAPSDDPLTLVDDLARLSLIAVEFPSFTDGRGYSIGRLLRQRLQYTGELRAVGDVLRDQLFFYQRCGFDSYALRDDQDVDDALKAFGDFSEVYQAGVDRGPLFARRAVRHGF